jgi:hypothetical protein
MKYVLLLAIAVVFVPAIRAEERAVRNLIPSWGDITLVYGPGTDAAMDTPEAMENMVKHWKGRGFTGVYLRSDLDQFPPGEVIRHKGKLQTNPGLAVYWRIVDEIMAKADPHKSMRDAAEKLGFEYWLSHPHIYSEGAPEEVGVDGPGRMVPWSYMLKYHRDHPEVITVDREGNKQWMVPEYGYPGVRANKAAEFGHMAKTYRPTGIIASMRSETSQLIPPPDHADQFGFNQVVVDDMKRLYNVDILTDPRFDWKSASFKSDDPMVQNWRDLRGSYITQLYREIRKAIKDANPNVKFAVGMSGEFVGPLMGNARLEWRKWIDEGIVDVIIPGMTFEATLDMDADKKGYLTNPRAGTGMVPTSEIKKYILASKHPEIQIIQTGAPSYFYPPAPDGADGWQCDAWYDAYTLAIYQRWEQWKKDLADMGSIKFFEQNFDGFKVKDGGIAGGMGDGRYHPDLRSCPGVWYKFGDSTDARPFVQQDVRRGNSGAAIALTGLDLTGVHYSSPDRSLLTGKMDTAIVNGKARLSFWIHRPTEQNSLTVYFTGSAQYERDVAVRVAAKTGRVSYASGSNWVESNTFVPLRQWYQITIDLDLDARTYSARGGEQEICSGIAIAPPVDRYVTQHGVESIKHKVPSYRQFDVLMFVPTEGSKDPIYLDDVLVQWQPTLHYAKPGARQVASENFEKLKFGATSFGSAFRVQDVNGQSVAFQVERTTSYGEGVHCLRAGGGGSFGSDLGQQLTLASSKGLITVDLDLFIRSDKDFPYIIPDPTTRSPHTVTIGIEGAIPDHPVAQVQPIDGTWRIFDGKQFVDTKTSVNYDVWNHLQLHIDTRAKTYRLIVQPIGEMPTVAGQAALGTGAQVGEKLRFVIRPSSTPDHLSCYDNIEVTSN